MTSPESTNLIVRITQGGMSQVVDGSFNLRYLPVGRVIALKLGESLTLMDARGNLETFANPTSQTRLPSHQTPETKN